MLCIQCLYQSIHLLHFAHVHVCVGGGGGGGGWGVTHTCISHIMGSVTLTSQRV